MALTQSRSLSLSIERDDWREHSACRDTDPDLFFPVGTTGPAIEQIETAKAVCRVCDVQKSLPRVRADHQPGQRHLGRHLRGGAPRHPPPVGRPPQAPDDPRPPLTGAPAGGGQPSLTAVSASPERRGRPRPRGRSARVSDTVVPRRSPAPSPDTIENSPARSLVTSVRTIDSPSPPTASSSNPAGRPTPSSATRSASDCPSRSIVDLHLPGPLATGRARAGRRGRRRSAAAR